jgi:hypothetical protein
VVGNAVGKPESSVPHDIATNRVICMSQADADREGLQKLPACSDGGPMQDLLCVRLVLAFAETPLYR